MTAGRLFAETGDPANDPPSDALSQQAFQSLQPFFAAYPRSLNNDVYLAKVEKLLGPSHGSVDQTRAAVAKWRAGRWLSVRAV